MSLEFRLPELGENIESGTVSKILIAVGDSVSVDQAVIELETEKAVVEVPSTISGTVTEIRVQVGKSVRVGDVVFVASGDATSAAEPEQAKPKPMSANAAPAADVESEPAKPKPAPPKAVSPPATGAAKSAPAPAEPKKPEPPLAPGSERTVLAAPSVRRLARELGVDISAVPASGPSGRVSSDDVRSLAGQAPVAKEPEPEAPEEPEAAPATDRDQWGAIERQPMNAIRRKTAMHMTNAWQTIPHVTHFDQADITSLEAFRKQYGKRAEAAGGKLTVTALLLKVLGAALRKFPRINATVDMENQEVIYKKYINIGVAVDTENGLLVPVVRDADRKGLLALAIEVNRLAEKARDRKLTLDEMYGGTFTITNLGGIGGTGFTPIINAPEVAVLGVSRSRIEPVFINGAFAPRTVLPLGLSYDHRVIDGAEAARFLRWVAEALEQPFVLLLEDEGVT